VHYYYCYYKCIMSLLLRRVLSMSPESAADQTLTRLHSSQQQQQQQQHRLDAGLMTSSSSSPWQPGVVVVKRELPSNAGMIAGGLDENRSTSVDSWTYVSPGAVTTATYYQRRPTTGWMQ